MDLKPVRPVPEVGFSRIAQGRVLRKAGRDDDSRAGSQKHQGGLVADLEAGPRDEGNSPLEGGSLKPLVVVESRTARAKGIVEVMEPAELLLADVAVAGLLEQGSGVSLGLTQQQTGRWLKDRVLARD